MPDSSITCRGFCNHCQEIHFLGQGGALQHAEELKRKLELHKRIDFDNEEANYSFNVDYLFGEARGQMFGVLECVDEKGETIVLKAFSCQYNSEWLVDGWVPPLLDIEKYYSYIIPADKEIKSLGAKIDASDEGSKQQLELKAKRKEISQQLMKDIHNLYELHNFRAEKKSLYEAFCLPKGIPTGTGDCCAPKLLNYAAQRNLKPVGLAEFYWGRENRSATRQHGKYYSSCENKCQPILGYMLCGFDK